MDSDILIAAVTAKQEDTDVATMRVGTVVAHNKDAGLIDVEVAGKTLHDIPYTAGLAPAVGEPVWLVEQSSWFLAVGAPDSTGQGAGGPPGPEGPEGPPGKPGSGSGSGGWSAGIWEAEQSHYVSDTTPDLPAAVPVDIDGAFSDIEYNWSTIGNLTQSFDDDSGVILTQVAAGAMTMWSDTVFTVPEAGTVNVLFYAARMASSVPIQMQAMLSYGGQGSSMDPSAGDTTNYAGTAVTTGDTATKGVGFSHTVPAGMTQVRVGFRVLPDTALNAKVRVLIAGANVRLGSWPVGSVWFNPSRRSATTVHRHQWLSAGSWFDILDSTKSTTPLPGSTTLRITLPDTGYCTYNGVLYVLKSGATVSGFTARVRAVHVTGPAATANIAETAYFGVGAGATNTYEISLPITGMFGGQAGSVFDVQLECWGTATNTANSIKVRNCGGTLTYIPEASAADRSTGDIETRWWDGSTWSTRSGFQTELVTVPAGGGAPVPPTKTNPTIVTARTPGTGTVGGSLSMTSTVSGGTGTPTGTATFYYSSSSSGPWTAISTSALNSSGVASASWKPPAGTWYIRSWYSGDGKYNGVGHTQTIATTWTAAPVITAQTKTVEATWVQAYNGSGGKISGSGRDTSVHQGYYSSTHGNRKSLLRFAPALPSDAEVTKVELICTSWEHWYNNAGGILNLGWHTNGSAPSSWSVGTGREGRGTYSATTGRITVDITSWAAAAVKKPEFRGIVVGPGPSTSKTYYGYSAGGTSPWRLKITYKSAT